MSLNDTPSGERIHIGIFGRTNAGKSSLINSLTNQDRAIVSEVPGTTTDPVSKAMELLPLGPVVIIDTPGIDDKGELGLLRVKRSYQELNKTDIALIVTDGINISDEDKLLIQKIEKKNIPYILVHNKCDNNEVSTDNSICVSAKTGYHIEELKNLIADTMKDSLNSKRIVGDLIDEGDLVILVVPIDKAAPKGRLILPQQMVLRDILDKDAKALVIKETQLEDTINSLNEKPKLVITDSQVFEYVSKAVPEDIMLTSFSILMARYKGLLDQSLEGIRRLKEVKSGDKILVSEACTHHRQCGDIGTQKIPNWVVKYLNQMPEFEFTSGGHFPEDLSEYKLVIHCGGCMLNEKEMKYRGRVCSDFNVPMVNYGVLISEINGILDRAIKPIKL